MHSTLLSVSWHTTHIQLLSVSWHTTHSTQLSVSWHTIHRTQLSVSWHTIPITQLSVSWHTIPSKLQSESGTFRLRSDHFDFVPFLFEQNNKLSSRSVISCRPSYFGKLNEIFLFLTWWNGILTNTRNTVLIWVFQIKHNLHRRTKRGRAAHLCVFLQLIELFIITTNFCFYI